MGVRGLSAVCAVVCVMHVSSTVIYSVCAFVRFYCRLITQCARCEPGCRKLLGAVLGVPNFRRNGRKAHRPIMGQGPSKGVGRALAQERLRAEIGVKLHMAIGD